MSAEFQQYGGRRRPVHVGASSNEGFHPWGGSPTCRLAGSPTPGWSLVTCPRVPLGINLEGCQPVAGGRSSGERPPDTFIDGGHPGGCARNAQMIRTIDTDHGSRRYRGTKRTRILPPLRGGVFLLCIPGVSLRSTPGYRLATLQVAPQEGSLLATLQDGLRDGSHRATLQVCSNKAFNLQGPACGTSMRGNRGGRIPWGRRPQEPADPRSASRVKAHIRKMRPRANADCREGMNGL